jgi:transcriptional regulator of acetoin/glycerol metabolism
MRLMKEMVYQSWKRCKERGLPKDILLPVLRLTDNEVRLLVNKHKVLISIFNSSIEEIKSFVTGQYIFLLTDIQGILLTAASSMLIERYAKESGIKLGMSFAEESCGTNAISMAMALKKPVYIRPEQHYCRILKKWYCYATPLWVNESVIGYVDVSTINQMMQKELMAIIELLSYQIGYKLKELKETEAANKVRRIKVENKMNGQQLQVLKLLAKGYTEKEIAVELCLNINTVKYHKKQIFGKLGAKSSAEAVARAIELKLTVQG